MLLAKSFQLVDLKTKYGTTCLIIEISTFVDDG